MIKIAWWASRRIAIIGVQLLATSFAVFALLYLMPGRPERILLGRRQVTEESLAAIRQKYNLDDPFLTQYMHWLRDAAHLDFGNSIYTNGQVTDLLSSRLPVTIQLALYASVMLLVIAVPLGLIAGVRAGSRTDQSISAVTTVMVSAPVFATGLVFLYVFSVWLGWFPVVGEGEGGLDTLWHLTLPAATLAIAVIGLVVRQTRATASVVARSDYVLFARARNVGRWTLWTRYLLRNSALPLATSIGLVISFFLTGAVIVEQTFSIPGVGALLLSSVANKDIPVVQGAAILSAAFILFANFLADAMYLAIDPRIRKQVLG